MKLVIVESPGKTKKIQAILGASFRVMASVGHVRDLPLKDIGVSAPEFKPHYQPTERGRQVISKLKSAALTSETVYLATDPDREGEAIAWHLQDALGLKDPKRITYTEITEQAIKEALLKARHVDMNLVRAQEGRRVLDRLVGYLVSNQLTNALGSERLSTGRVQTPALKLVVERERALADFKVTTHFGVSLNFSAMAHVSEGWNAEWQPKAYGWLQDSQEYVEEKELAERIAQIRSVKVIDYAEKESKIAPAPPFTTSSLQQAASSRLKLSPKQTMELAQKLYEAGHITYMRTDSPNLSLEATAAIRSWACQRDMPLPSAPRTWKSKDDAQEAHEAIRPTHIDIETAGSDENEKALYQLIRLRAVASQLESAVYAATQVTLLGDLDGRQVQFNAQGRKMVSAGWKNLFDDDEPQGDDSGQPAQPIPRLEKGQPLMVVSGKVLTKKTKPPVRYSEASLIKELESKGIGRPSTYAAILENISARGYVELENRQLKPTKKGEKIITALDGRFSFMDYEFTKALETHLDDIAQGKTTYLEVVRQFYGRLQSELQSFVSATSFSCPQCGKPLRLISKLANKSNKGFKFYGCSGYPECKATYNSKDNQPVINKEQQAYAEQKQY